MLLFARPIEGIPTRANRANQSRETGEPCKTTQNGCQNVLPSLSSPRPPREPSQTRTPPASACRCFDNTYIIRFFCTCAYLPYLRNGGCTLKNTVTVQEGASANSSWPGVCVNVRTGNTSNVSHRSERCVFAADNSRYILAVHDGLGDADMHHTHMRKVLRPTPENRRLAAVAS